MCEKNYILNYFILLFQTRRRHRLSFSYFMYEIYSTIYIYNIKKKKKKNMHIFQKILIKNQYPRRKIAKEV